MPATRESLPWLYAIALLSSFATTFLAMACESLLAYDTPHDQKGRASGWYQAGNLGGGGLGGGAGLWMAQALPAPWMSGAILAIACFACCLALLFIREPVSDAARCPLPPRPRQRARATCGRSRSRGPGCSALLICFLPLGTGAASGLWSAVASDWSASADTVALVTGVVGGVASADRLLHRRLGCATAWSARTRTRSSACLLALCAIGMAVAPRTEAMYIVLHDDLLADQRALVRRLHRHRAGDDRAGRGGDQVQPLRVAVQHADRVHDRRRRLGAHALGRRRHALHGGRHRHPGDRRVLRGREGAVDRPIVPADPRLATSADDT